MRKSFAGILTTSPSVTIPNHRPMTPGPSMADLLFLDTEWNNDAVRELVSLALVNADATQYFYAERAPRPGASSSFVSKVVYPLLDGGDAALSDENFGEQLRAFVASFDHPRIHFDGAIDKRQLARALAGFGTWSGEVPAWEPVLVTRQDVLGEQEVYFGCRPEKAARRHHAAVDAEALRAAYITIVGL